MKHGLKYIAFYVQKHITPWTVVITSLLVRDKPQEAPANVKRVFLIWHISNAGYLLLFALCVFEGIETVIGRSPPLTK